MSRDLTLVAPRTIAQRVADLQREAREAASAHVHELLAIAAECERLANEVAAGGDPYPPGIREAARQMGEFVAANMKIIQKVGGPE